MSQNDSFQRIVGSLAVINLKMEHENIKLAGAIDPFLGIYKSLAQFIIIVCHWILWKFINHILWW